MRGAMRWQWAVLGVLPALVAGCAGANIGAERGAGGAVTPSAIVEPTPIEAGIAPAAGEYPPGFDALHYEIAVALPDTGTWIRGATTVRIARTATAPATLPLDLTGLAVTAVRVNGEAVGYRQGSGKLRIALPDSGRAGELSVQVRYQGRPDDGLIIGANVHGARAAFVDNWPNRARFWFPSIDQPADKATVSLTVYAPAGWQVVGNGVALTGNAPRDTLGLLAGGSPGTVTRWVESHPISTYNMVLGAGAMTILPMGSACPSAGGWEAFTAGNAAVPARCVPVSAWLFPEDVAFGRQIFRRAPEMIARFSELVAPFPYEKLAHVQSSTRFGGMENVTAIFYDEKAIAAGKLSEETVAHETAHQWFGDAVTEADWHHLWLSEGFATYFAGLFMERADGPAAFREYMEAQRKGYVASPVTDRPIVDPAERNLFALLNANNYQKGAWVLHMLRGELGDSAFFRGIRDYYRAHEHGTALTDDLREALESASGKELGWFFEQWVFRPGYPQLRARLTGFDASTGRAKVELEQVQPAAWPTFRLTVPVELRGARGSVRQAVELSARQVEVEVPVQTRPDSVVVDPDGTLLKG